jgi:chlorobactene glucosyltransferase
LLQYLAHDEVLGIIAFQCALILICVSNAWLLSRTGARAAPKAFPLVSVMLPARNEEVNIRRCVASLLAQDYPEFEVFVLDDQSSDRTRAILGEMAQGESRLTVVDGLNLPAGWTGKNWACAQLAERAAGEVFLFTDADTWHQPHALRTIVTALEGERADLVSGFPRQELRTWGERLTVPFIGLVFFCLVPCALAYRLKVPALSSAIGQVLLFRRRSYQAVGGHAAVRGTITEDLALARRIRAHGYRWRLMDAAGIVSCRMYRGGREAHLGLAKNLFAAFDYRMVPYLLAWLWLAAVFLGPLALTCLGAAGQLSLAEVAPSLASLGLSVGLLLLAYHRLGLPAWLALLYPATILAMESVAFRSLWLSFRGHLAWKERALPTPHWRWI